MAEDRAITASKYSGEIPTFAGGTSRANGVDAGVKPAQAPNGETVTDRTFTGEQHQLLASDNAVLLIGDRRNLDVEMATRRRWHEFLL